LIRPMTDRSTLLALCEAAHLRELLSSDAVIQAALREPDVLIQCLGHSAHAAAATTAAGDNTDS
jgi:hypothetical protein